ncbi:hypothetical protein [Microcoleus anatoxicus]|uniref:Uncharacterized protein n=1 Tax=Microcoleus anatoxicus PTRS2 TaxID=2705321 RepID=A0ABU8YRT0_9CYAN
MTYSKGAIAGLASGIDEGRSLFPAKIFVTKRAIGLTLPSMAIRLTLRFALDLYIAKHGSCIYPFPFMRYQC